MTGGRWREGAIGGVGRARWTGAGSRVQPPPPSRCQNPACSEPGSEKDTGHPGAKAALGGSGHRAPPLSVPQPLTHPPMWACQLCRLGSLASVETPSGWSNIRPGCGLIGCAHGTGQRPLLIGWRPWRRRNATGRRSAPRPGSGRTERFRCVR